MLCAKVSILIAGTKGWVRLAARCRLRQNEPLQRSKSRAETTHRSSFIERDSSDSAQLRNSLKAFEALSQSTSIGLVLDPAR
jgi:hypothetical protein